MSHAVPPLQRELNAIFAGGYAVRAAHAGLPFEPERKRAFANWLTDLVPGTGSLSVFEVGAGDGSLMRELQQIRPGWRLRGLEPSPACADAARAEGLDVITAFLGEEVPRREQHDLVVAVNVAEHVADPVRFLELLGRCATPDGILVVICPDGAQVSTEFLIFDHVHSFEKWSLRQLALKAGLALQRWEAAPHQLGPFQAAVLTKRSSTLVIQPPDSHGLAEARARYLSAWRALDEELQKQITDWWDLEAFGIGETADLLRVYAPQTWSRVGRAAIDGGSGCYAGLPVVNYRELCPMPSRRLLLAVRPEVQTGLRQRLEADGHGVVAWDQLLR